MSAPCIRLSDYALAVRVASAENTTELDREALMIPAEQFFEITDDMTASDIAKKLVEIVDEQARERYGSDAELMVKTWEIRNGIRREMQYT